MSPNSKRLLITGASGFIGRHLVESLKRSHTIYALSHEPPKLISTQEAQQIEWMQTDVSEPDELAKSFQRVLAEGGVDVVIHLAGYYDFTGKKAPEYQRVNVDGTRNVLDLSRQLHPRRFIFASSVAACDFSSSGHAIDEATLPNGETYYARSKKAGEKLVRQYGSEFPVCIVRFGAVFTDWCQYEPLYYFLSRWLSFSWRRRILGGRGESAIPFLHIRDAVAFVTALIERQEQLSHSEILVASPDSATSHRELHAAATACFYGQRVRPILLPPMICRMGLWSQDVVAHMLRRQTFERPWMGRCIDKRLEVDASNTRSRLSWAPTERLHILRRMPFIIHNFRADPAEWLRRNNVAADRVRLRTAIRTHNLISAHRDEICARFLEYLEEPTHRDRFAAYLNCSDRDLEERHRLVLSQLMCSVRTGDKAVFMNCCRHLAERWYSAGLPLRELWEGLESLGRICLEVLREDPESANLSRVLHDQITMTFQFAVDAVQELDEIFSSQSI